MHNIGGGIVPALTDTQHTELFFWTPHMPEIVIKQSQVIKVAIDLDRELVKTCSIFVNERPANFDTRRLYGTDNYENKIAKLIYTHTKDVIWQVKKPENRAVAGFIAKFNFFYQYATKKQLSNLLNGMQYLNQNKFASQCYFSKKHLVRS